jgi:hypothetical protein
MINLQPEAVMRIRDVYNGSRVKKIPDPGSAANISSIFNVSKL